jgi:hypothetical protein
MRTRQPPRARGRVEGSQIAAGYAPLVYANVPAHVVEVSSGVYLLGEDRVGLSVAVTLVSPVPGTSIRVIYRYCLCRLRSRGGRYRT